MNSDKRDVRSDFTDVDRASDPGHLVRFLNTVSALDVIRAYKRRSFDLLGLQPGQVVLDLGCGNGDDVRELAQLVGTTGRVVGVDRSETLIATARERLGEDKLPVEFQVGDAYGLNFPNDMFDGCRADRVFHHMVKPEQGIAELVRVARSGARVVTIDPDFETAIVDAPDPALTRTLLNLNCDSYRNGQIGRHMRAMFIEAGLIDVGVEPLTVLLEDYGLANQVLALEGTVTRAQEAELVNAADGERWLATLQDASAAGRFLALMALLWVRADLDLSLVWAVCGQNPGESRHNGRLTGTAS